MRLRCRRVSRLTFRMSAVMRQSLAGGCDIPAARPARARPGEIDELGTEYGPPIINLERWVERCGQSWAPAPVPRTVLRPDSFARYMLASARASSAS